MRIADLVAGAAKFFGWLSILLLPVRPALIAISFLVMADFLTGLWASIKENKKITSHKLRRTVMKGLAYQCAIVVAFVIETYLMQDMPVVKVVTGLIGVTEGKSFFENIHRITGIDFWSQIISKINLADHKGSDDESK